MIIQVPCCAKPGQVRCFRHYFERTGIASAMWRSGRDRTIVILGKRGVGKSTTLNYLFGFALATDPAAECTTAPFPQLVTSPLREQVRVVDMPGIAATVRSFQRYRRYYRHWLRRADVVVWITQANVRAYKQDQIFFRDFSRYVRPDTRLVLALSKFDTQVDGLGEHQGIAAADRGLLDRKIADVTAEILPYTWASGDLVSVVPYSVAKKWNIEQLRSVIFARASNLRIDMSGQETVNGPIQ